MFFKTVEIRHQEKCPLSNRLSLVFEFYSSIKRCNQAHYPPAEGRKNGGICNQSRHMESRVARTNDVIAGRQTIIVRRATSPATQQEIDEETFGRMTSSLAETGAQNRKRTVQGAVNILLAKQIRHHILLQAGAHLPLRLFEPAKRPDDRADCCLYSKRPFTIINIYTICKSSQSSTFTQFVNLHNHQHLHNL